MRRLHLSPAAVDYPTSDGKRLAENDPPAPRQSLRVRRVAAVLRGTRRRVRLGGPAHLLRGRQIPGLGCADVFVVFGVEDRMRGNDGPLTNALGERAPHVPLIGSFGEIPESGSGVHAGMQTASGDDWG